MLVNSIIQSWEISCAVLVLLAIILICYEPCMRFVGRDAQGKPRFVFITRGLGFLGWSVMAFSGVVSLFVYFMFLNFSPKAIHAIPEAGMQEDELIRQSIAAAYYFGPAGRVDLDGPSRDSNREADKLREIFPDPAEFELVSMWGQKLRSPQIEEKWVPNRKKHSLSSVEQANRGLAGLPGPGERAYRRLAGVPGATVQKLSDLKATIERSIPDPTERANLLAWAAKRRVLKGMPETEWFSWWILLEDWCATPEVFAARQRAIENLLGATKFGHGMWPALLKWGMELAVERRKLEPTFPGPSDRASFVAAVDRLTGQDPVMQKLARAYDQGNDEVVPEARRGPVFLFAFHLFCVKDDQSLLVFGDGWLKDGTERTTASRNYVFVTMLFILAWGLALQRTARLLSIRVYAGYLNIADNPKLLSYDATIFHVGWNVLSLLILLPFSWLITRATLDPFYVLYVQNESALVLAVFWTVFIGSILVEVIQHLISVVFIYYGIDPERTVIDNVICIVLAVGILRFYENNWISIISGVALGLAMSLVHKRLIRPSQRKGALTEPGSTG